MFKLELTRQQWYRQHDKIINIIFLCRKGTEETKETRERAGSERKKSYALDAQF